MTTTRLQKTNGSTSGIGLVRISEMEAANTPPGSKRTYHPICSLKPCSIPKTTQKATANKATAMMAARLLSDEFGLTKRIVTHRTIALASSAQRKKQEHNV